MRSHSLAFVSVVIFSVRISLQGNGIQESGWTVTCMVRARSMYSMAASLPDNSNVDTCAATRRRCTALVKFVFTMIYVITSVFTYVQTYACGDVYTGAFLNDK